MLFLFTGGSSAGKNRIDKSSPSGSDSDATSQRSALRVFGPMGSSSAGIASPPSTTMTGLNGGDRVGSSSSERSSATSGCPGASGRMQLQPLPKAPGAQPYFPSAPPLAPAGPKPQNSELAASTNSFNMAMSNPCNFFVDSV